MKKLGDWLSHPVNLLVGSVGAVASIVSILLYFQSIEKRDLNFYVHPVKATVVKAGQASQLAVSFAGQVVTNDITAAQIALWNAGKRPIKKTEILEPIVISCGSGHPILEAVLKRTTRPLIRATLETTNAESGEIGISWDILEQSDGVVIQVVYAGDAAVPFQVNGTIEGQGNAPPKIFSEQLVRQEEAFEPGRGRKLRGFGLACAVLVACGVSYLAFLERKEKGLMRVLNIVLVSIVLLSLSKSLWDFIQSPDSPPFNF